MRFLKFLVRAINLVNHFSALVRFAITVFLFSNQMGKFYELFEMDAHVGAKELGLQYMKVLNFVGCLFTLS